MNGHVVGNGQIKVPCRERVSPHRDDEIANSCGVIDLIDLSIGMMVVILANPRILTIIFIIHQEHRRIVVRTVFMLARAD